MLTWRFPRQAGAQHSRLPLMPNGGAMMEQLDLASYEALFSIDRSSALKRTGSILAFSDRRYFTKSLLA